MAKRDEAGLTLIEILVAVLVMAIIVGPITAAIIVGFETTTASSKQLAGSDDRQLLELYLPPDVTSATQVLTTSTETSVAGSPTTPCQGTTSTAVLMLSWSVIAGLSNGQPGTTTTFEEVDYVTQVAAGFGGSPPTIELVRYVFTPTFNGGFTTKTCGSVVGSTPVAFKLGVLVGNVTIASGSTSATDFLGYPNVGAGMSVSGNNIPANTTVIAANDTVLTLSAAATGSANETLTFGTPISVAVSGTSPASVTVTFMDFTRRVFSVTAQER